MQATACSWLPLRAHTVRRANAGQAEYRVTQRGWDALGAPVERLSTGGLGAPQNVAAQMRDHSDAFL